MGEERTQKQAKVVAAVLLSLLLLFFVGLPVVKLGDKSVPKGVVCTNGPGAEKLKGDKALYSFIAEPLSKNAVVEIYNSSNRKEGVVLDFIGPKGEVTQSCIITLPAKSIESIPVGVKSSVARLSLVSSKIGGYIKGDSFNLPFKSELVKEKLIILNNESRRSGKFFLSNFSNKNHAFLVSSRTSNGEINEKHVDDTLFELKPFEIKSLKVSEISKLASESAIVSVTAVNESRESVEANFDFTHIGSGGSIIKSQKPVADIAYLPVLTKVINSKKVDNLKNIISFHNPSSGESSLSVYFQGTDGGVIPLHQASKFCEERGRIEKDHLILDLKAYGTIECSSETLLAELKSREGKLVLIPNSKAPVFARSAFYKQGQKGKLKLAFQIPAQQPDKGGSYKILPIGEYNGTERYLNLHNMTEGSLTVPLLLQSKDGKDLSTSVSMDSFSSISFPVSKKFRLKNSGKKSLLRTSSNVYAEVLQVPLTKASRYNLFESQTFKGQDSDGTIDPSQPKGQYCSAIDSRLKADFNQDGLVDDNDRLILEDNSGRKTRAGCDGDVDGDGDVDAFDLLLMGKSWTGDGGIDSDEDGVFDHEDCSADDSTTWKDEAFKDIDEDGFMESAEKSKVKCFGAVAPAGHLANETSLDNCPSVPNPDQFDYDSNGVGDACAFYNSEEGEGSDAGSNGFRNPQTFKPLKSNPNGLEGEKESA